MDIEDLKNPEFQKKLMSAQSPEQLFSLAREEGCELTDEQLESISGGWADTDEPAAVTCPRCSSTNTGITMVGLDGLHLICRDCKYRWLPR